MPEVSRSSSSQEYQSNFCHEDGSWKCLTVLSLAPCSVRVSLYLSSFLWFSSCSERYFICSPYVYMYTTIQKLISFFHYMQNELVVLMLLSISVRFVHNYVGIIMNRNHWKVQKKVTRTLFQPTRSPYNRIIVKEQNAFTARLEDRQISVKSE